MMPARTWTKTLWWLIQKDLLRESRAPLVIPAMSLVGLVVALVLQMQWGLGADPDLRLTSASFWIAVLLAGTLAMDRSFANERSEGCWQALILYPVAPTVIYLSKVAANVLALTCLECILAVAFWILGSVPLAACPGGLVLVAVLGNLAVAALGTLLSALTQKVRRLGPLLILLLLPSALPMLLGASEATRRLLLGDFGVQTVRWIELLGISAVVFLAAGILVFDFVIED